jgi:hypothetical protein
MLKGGSFLEERSDVLQCDGCDTIVAGHRHMMWLRELRARAASLGWSVEGDRDFCRQCRKKAGSRTPPDGSVT